jgi:acetylglutamate kinase
LSHYNVEPEFKDGLRVTSEQVLDVTCQTLIGKVNPQIVTKLNKKGRSAIGINGMDAQFYGFVGTPTFINTELLSHLTAHYIPVIASIGLKQGTTQQYNINADTLAYKVAEALAAPLYILSDIPGVLIEDQVQHSLCENDIKRYIAENHIYGGMIPKVQDAVLAINNGCTKVIIAAGSEQHIVQKVHEGQSVGTTIY